MYSLADSNFSRVPCGHRGLRFGKDSERKLALPYRVSDYSTVISAKMPCCLVRHPLPEAMLTVFISSFTTSRTVSTFPSITSNKSPGRNSSGTLEELLFCT